MLVYLLTAAVAMLAALFAEGLREENPKVSDLLWFVAFLALTIPASLRYDIGVDYSASMESAGYLGYWQLYHLYANQPPASGMDPGFYALIRILNLFTDNPQWMFAFLSAATYALVIRACRR
ncbi:EpsG family protein, partial [uncultured Parolsenella sp.]|uniref:EpsG family protein n=1 Tax=uncultured Parolsenella sp. TaxID=2083008 RepID=UPI0025955D39